MPSTYSNNTSENTNVRKGVLDVLEVNLSGLPGASAVLPAGVLSTDLLGEVLGVADVILTVKEQKGIHFVTKGNDD